jgi:hypothetical protein
MNYTTKGVMFQPNNTTTRREMVLSDQTTKIGMVHVNRATVKEMIHEDPTTGKEMAHLDPTTGREMVHLDPTMGKEMVQLHPTKGRQMVHLDPKIYLSTVTAEEFKRMPKNRSLAVKMRFSCITDLSRLERYLQSDNAKEALQKISGALTRLNAGQTNLTTSIDAIQMKEALSKLRFIFNLFSLYV